MVTMNHKNHNILALFALTVSASAATPQMLQAVAFVESTNNPQAIGDSGLARGMYQMHKPAWEQVSASRKSAGLPVYDWSYAHDKVISVAYAKAYLEWLEAGLRKRLGREPQPWEVYASYNRGLQGFAKLDYDFGNLPKHTQRACLKVAQSTQSLIPKR